VNKTSFVTKDTLPVLEAVRGLLATEGAWIKNNSSTDKSGQPVGYWDERACRFSLDGAILRCSHVTNRAGSGAYGFLKYTIHPKGITTVASWNDATQTTLGAVIELLNRAIVELGGEALELWKDEGEDHGI
jgi:hypothetical protein